MDRQAIELAKRAIVERHGPWTAANVDLGEGVFTIDRARSGPHPHLVRFGQLIADFAGRDFVSLRVLDLACLEGEYAIEFARKGRRSSASRGARRTSRKRFSRATRSACGT